MTDTDRPSTALVTGAAGGLGRAVARRLAGEGRPIALSDATEAVHQVAAEVNAAGGTARGYVCDVADAEACAAVHEAAVADLGPIVNVVPAAAIVDQVQRAWKLAPADFRREVEVNLCGAFNTISPALGALRELGGRIVVVSSVGALTGLGGQAAYTASKAGLVGMVRSLAVELAPFGVTVNAVLPGTIATPKFEAMPDHVKAQMLDAVPLGRFATVDEVADLIAFLLSDAAAYVTGSDYVIDGGLRLGNLTLGRKRG